MRIFSCQLFPSTYLNSFRFYRAINVSKPQQAICSHPLNLIVHAKVVNLTVNSLSLVVTEVIRPERRKVGGWWGGGRESGGRDEGAESHRWPAALGKL